MRVSTRRPGEQELDFADASAWPGEARGRGANRRIARRSFECFLAQGRIAKAQLVGVDPRRALSRRSGESRVCQYRMDEHAQLNRVRTSASESVILRRVGHCHLPATAPTVSDLDARAAAKSRIAGEPRASRGDCVGRRGWTHLRSGRLARFRPQALIEVTRRMRRACDVRLRRRLGQHAHTRRRVTVRQRPVHPAGRKVEIDSAKSDIQVRTAVVQIFHAAGQNQKIGGPRGRDVQQANRLFFVFRGAGDCVQAVPIQGAV